MTGHFAKWPFPQDDRNTTILSALLPYCSSSIRQALSALPDLQSLCRLNTRILLLILTSISCKQQGFPSQHMFDNLCEWLQRALLLPLHINVLHQLSWVWQKKVSEREDPPVARKERKTRGGGSDKTFHLLCISSQYCAFWRRGMREREQWGGEVMCPFNLGHHCQWGRRGRSVGLVYLSYGRTHNTNSRLSVISHVDRREKANQLLDY